MRSKAGNKPNPNGITFFHRFNDNRNLLPEDMMFVPLSDLFNHLIKSWILGLFDSGFEPISCGLQSSVMKTVGCLTCFSPCSLFSSGDRWGIKPEIYLRQRIWMLNQMNICSETHVAVSGWYVSCWNLQRWGSNQPYSIWKYNLGQSRH